MMQDPGGLRGPQRATPGATIEVDVAGGWDSVRYGIAGSGQRASLPVGPSKKVLITVPPVPGGNLLVVRVGTGLSGHIILIEIVETLTP